MHAVAESTPDRGTDPLLVSSATNDYGEPPVAGTLTGRPATTSTNLDCHMFDSTADSNHIFTLIKLLVSSYTKTRMHHLAKQKTAEVTGISVCKQFSKLVLFKHQ